MIRRSRHRLKVALLVILCLLFQQAALAAYLCPIDQVHATPAVMAANCAEMDMTQAPDHTVLCDKHCNPDRVLAAVFFCLWFLYFALAASQFYSGNSAIAAIKGGIAVVFTQVWTVIIAMGFLYFTTRLHGG